ncbi:MAG: glycoside hydrolase family 15 protein [Myxococcota bacterium]
MHRSAPLPPADPSPRLDHGAVGNGRIIALVAPTAAVEWLCLPRFDAPAVFARLLDRDRGGAFRLLAGDREIAGEASYVRNTNVLATTFRDGDAAWEVIDYAPRLPDGLGVTAPAALVRIVRPIAGAPVLVADVDLRPGYAAAEAERWERPGALEYRWPGGAATLSSNLPTAYLRGARPFVLDRPRYFALEWGPPAAPWSLDRAMRELELTIAGWRAWAKRCALPSFAPETVLRSALCLKLHAYEDTGAIVAAATTSIPEALGTPRTWDYRYCWLRDAAFVVEALRRLSHLAEGERFLGFLRDVAEGGPLQPVYAIDGRRDLEEVTLPHLAGFGGTGPVRVGNAAAVQRQNDLCGELVLSIDALLADPRIDPDVAAGLFPLVTRLVEEAITAAPTTDTGIWEFRSLLRHYTFSRVMCWAAAARGARIATRYGQGALAARWAAFAEAERATILQRAFREPVGFFTQALDGEFPDASNLLLPTIGLIDARDPRFVATLDAYERDLAARGLMRRYRNEDDFGETTSAFTICSFWWAEALALAGRLEAAVEVFERVARHANPVGLFSEDIDPETGALLGNFPQAYTHVGAIHAATTIGALLDARDGRVRAWS